MSVDSPRADARAPRLPTLGPGWRTPSRSLIFDGAGDACSCSPPDPNGDVGQNNYVQIVNKTKVAMYNKAGRLQTRFDLGALWPSGTCTSDDGDPNVVYDPIADRWVLAQLSGTAVAALLCFAVSRTPDPTGAYFTYAFDTPSCPTTSRSACGRTATTCPTNESTYTAYALNRAKMLAGDRNGRAVRFPGETNLLHVRPTSTGAKARANRVGSSTRSRTALPRRRSAVDRIELFR